MEKEPIIPHPPPRPPTLRTPTPNKSIAPPATVPTYASVAANCCTPTDAVNPPPPTTQPPPPKIPVIAITTCLDCRTHMPMSTLTKHKQTDCLQALVSCSSHEVGCCMSFCSGKVRRGDNGAHLQAVARDPAVIRRYIERIKAESAARTPKEVVATPASPLDQPIKAKAEPKLILPAPWKPTPLPTAVKPPTFGPIITINFVKGTYKGQLKSGARHGTGTMTYN
eukprot:gene43811-54442_t